MQITVAKPDSGNYKVGDQFTTKCGHGQLKEGQSARIAEVKASKPTGMIYEVVVESVTVQKTKDEVLCTVTGRRYAK